MKTLAKTLINQLGGYVFGPGTVPKGVDIFHDLRRFGYAGHITTVFDIGANVGQFAASASTSLDGARLFCFEPVKATFETLQKNIGLSTNAKVFNLAMGSAKGQLRMTSKADSVMNHVVKTGEILPPDVAIEMVPVNTVADAARELGVDRIGLLKTDTEGFDLEVLQGAVPLLSSGKVFLVLVEVGFSDTDKGHTPFAAVRGLLSGFDLVGFYEQGTDANFSALDRADALFIHRETARTLLPVRW